MVIDNGNRGDPPIALKMTIGAVALKYHRKCSEKAIATLVPRTDNRGTRTKGTSGDTSGSPRR